jgi:CPA1 family monovalent cation:H+ antiporter
VGFVAAWLIHRLQVRLTDPPIEITLSLMAPYVSYLLAESIHVSGPLATVVCGLYLGHKSSEVFSTQARLENAAVWNTLDFLLNGVVFILIGLQLPFILGGIRGISHHDLLLDGGILTVVVIALRMFWMYPGAWLAYLIRTRLLKQDYGPPRARAVFVLGWTGMRGVLALAAAISLPRLLDDGSPFPQREVIIFLTFCVILITLVVQGLTLPSIIRKLGLCEADPLETVEREARKRMLRGALEYLESIESDGARPDEAVWLDVLHHYKERYAMVDGHKTGVEDPTPRQWSQMYDLNSRVRAVERATLSKMRYEDRISDHVLRKLERELDLLDARFVPRA